jgi:hypothetical protein
VIAAKLVGPVTDLQYGTCTASLIDRLTLLLDTSLLQVWQGGVLACTSHDSHATLAGPLCLWHAASCTRTLSCMPHPACHLQVDRETTAEEVNALIKVCSQLQGRVSYQGGGAGNRGY